MKGKKITVQLSKRIRIIRNIGDGWSDDTTLTRGRQRHQ